MSRKKKYYHYNNGIINKKFAEDEIIPEGWVRGLKPRSKEEIQKSNNKRKQTNIKKYGVDNSAKSQEVKDKTRSTNLKRYGSVSPAQNAEIKEKTEQTCLNKYQTKSPSQNDSIKEKMKRTCIDNYGVDNPMKSKSIQDKAVHTNIDKYGVKYPSQSDKIKKDIVQTNLKRYGTEYPSQSNEIKDKIRNTNLDNLGVANPFQSSEIQDKIKKTNLEKYGTSNYFESEDFKVKTQSTNRKKYGYDHAVQSDIVKSKIQKTNLEKYGVLWSCQRPEARLGYSNNSSPNLEFEKILKNNNIQYEREFSLERYSYDFKVNNTLIEIDPYPTHNTLWGIFDKSHGIDKNYHKDKSEVASKHGYQCIHIFDWDDEDKIVCLLKDRQKVYARKCSVQEVSKGDCGTFLEENHLQGTCRGQTIRLGLYYENTLVSIMTFGKPRYNKGYEYELLRYCSTYNVVGGSNKLFKYFIGHYNPKSIVSYCDTSKFIGNTYINLGFTKSQQGRPSKHWYNIKSKEHITDNILRQRGYDQLFGTDYGKGTSNEELMIQNNFVPIYDCGQDTYEYLVK